MPSIATSTHAVATLSLLAWLDVFFLPMQHLCKNATDVKCPQLQFTASSFSDPKALVCRLSPKMVEFQNHSEELMTPGAVHVSMSE